MSIDEIKRLIAGDEHRTLELKKTTGELKDGMHTACAFLRGSGVNRIVETCQKRKVATPTWSVDGGYVVVTFARDMEVIGGTQDGTIICGFSRGQERT